MTPGVADEALPGAAWHALSIDAALAMARSTRAGLSELEARARLQQYQDPTVSLLPHMRLRSPSFAIN